MKPEDVKYKRYDIGQLKEVFKEMPNLTNTMIVNGIAGSEEEQAEFNAAWTKFCELAIDGEVPVLEDLYVGDVIALRTNFFATLCTQTTQS